MALIEPLNLQYIFVNTLAGNMTIFIILMTILIAGLAARFKMNNFAFGLTIALFATLMGAWASWFMFLVVLMGGFLIYYTIGKLLIR